MKNLLVLCIESNLIGGGCTEDVRYEVVSTQDYLNDPSSNMLRSMMLRFTLWES